MVEGYLKAGGFVSLCLCQVSRGNVVPFCLGGPVAVLARRRRGRGRHWSGVARRVARVELRERRGSRRRAVGAALCRYSAGVNITSRIYRRVIGRDEA